MIKVSKHGVWRKAKLQLACERSGTYRQPKNRSDRQELQHKGTRTKKCDCPFKLHEFKLAIDDKWYVIVVCGYHNHLLAKKLEDHSFFDQLSNKEKDIVKNIT